MKYVTIKVHDHLDKKDTKKLHYVYIHRLQCVSGIKLFELVFKACNNFVDNSMYDIILLNNNESIRERVSFKQYRKVAENWYIPNEAIADPPWYWMWFVCRFYKDLVVWSGAVEAGIPQDWKPISKLKAIESLAKSYEF